MSFVFRSFWKGSCDRENFNRSSTRCWRNAFKALSRPILHECVPRPVSVRNYFASQIREFVIARRRRTWQSGRAQKRLPQSRCSLAKTQLVILCNRVQTFTTSQILKWSRKSFSVFTGSSQPEAAASGEYPKTFARLLRSCFGSRFCGHGWSRTEQMNTYKTKFEYSISKNPCLSVLLNRETKFRVPQKRLPKQLPPIQLQRTF